ncbi:MAG: class I SAM-dependent methyltransferase [Pseudomonadota bacterium]
MEEVPSPLDFRTENDAKAWASEATRNRPYRTKFFHLITKELMQHYQRPKILELGSGPGELANYIVTDIECTKYVAFDFSQAMHDLAIKQFPKLVEKVEFENGNFKAENWSKNLTGFDAVISMQAIHEIRHKFLTVKLFKQIKSCLADTAIFLYCDHYFGESGLEIVDLYMTDEEKKQTLELAGFNNIRCLHKEGTLSLWKAEN